MIVANHTEKEAPVSRPSSARRLPNERDFHLDVRLAGLDVTLCDSVADVVRANITGGEAVRWCSINSAH